MEWTIAWEYKISLAPSSIRTPDRPARSLVVIAPTLPLLLSTVYYLRNLKVALDNPISANFDVQICSREME
jgi:hypothetical protein